MITATDAQRLVAHIADALREPTYPDAEYLRHNVARVLREGTRKGQHASARGAIVWTVREALRGEHAAYVRAELLHVLRDDALRVRGYKVRRDFVPTPVQPSYVV